MPDRLDDDVWSPTWNPVVAPAETDQDWETTTIAARWPDPLPWHELAGEVAR